MDTNHETAENIELSSLFFSNSYFLFVVALIALIALNVTLISGYLARTASFHVAIKRNIHMITFLLRLTD